MTPEPHRRPVGIWLLAVALLVVVQVSLGGITRLTDSGLSITEWNLLLGVVPPLDEAGWNEAFAKYQQIPQYRLLKSHLTLAEFKTIYFWEWFHRLFGRMLGFAFLGPFLFFHFRRRLDGLYLRLGALFVLGGLQGVMGWLMVVSGLSERVYVSHLKLAVHFVLAAVLFVALVHLGLRLAAPFARLPAVTAERARTLRRAADALIVLLFVQFTWGAFMAGLKAAAVAPTWPTINGVFVPAGLLEGGGLANNPLSVHFVHRTLAYVLTAAICAFAFIARRALGREAPLAAGLVLAQATLGVLVTVTSHWPGYLLPLGVAHQVVAYFLLGALVVARWRLATAVAAPAAGGARVASGATG